MQIVVIGTLHGFTPENELRSLLEVYNPNLLLVEIAQEDIASGNMSVYPPEMISAHHWAVENGIAVAGFDLKADTSALEEGLFSDELIDEISRRYDGIISQFNWKDFNRPEINNLLDVPEIDNNSFVREFESKREQGMLSNIRKLTDGKYGTAAMLTGCGHLGFFEASIPEAVFPFRKMSSN